MVASLSCVVNAHETAALVFGLFSWISEAEIENALEGLENAEWALKVAVWTF